MSAAETMIRVEGLTRVYAAQRGGRPAVDGISFEVKRGEVLGFLGPNGAGKSTTLKMLTCYLPPTAGRAAIAGHDVFDQPLAVRQHIGYLPEETPLYRDMTVYAYLRFAAEMRRITRSDRRARIAEVAATTGITGVMGKLVRELSRGFRQRVGLAQALLHNPPVLFLDEPTSGLDPNQIVEIRQLIRDIGREKTVMLSTHILPEVQATCDRVLIIHEGRLVADGAPDALADQLAGGESGGRYRLLLGQTHGDLTAPTAEAARTAIADLPGVKTVLATAQAGGELELDVIGEGSGDLRLALFRLASRAHWPLLELDRRSLSLEEVFARLTRSEASA